MAEIPTRDSLIWNKVIAIAQMVHMGVMEKGEAQDNGVTAKIYRMGKPGSNIRIDVSMKGVEESGN